MSWCPFLYLYQHWALSFALTLTNLMEKYGVQFSVYFLWSLVMRLFSFALHFSFGKLSVLFPLPVCLIFVWCGRLPFLFSLFWLLTPFYSFQLLGTRWLGETHFSSHYRSDSLLSGRMEDGSPASGGPQTQSMWMTFSSTSLPFSVLRAQSPALLSPGPVGLEGAASCGSRWWHDSFTQPVVYLSPPVSTGTVLGMAWAPRVEQMWSASRYWGPKASLFYRSSASVACGLRFARSFAHAWFPLCCWDRRTFTFFSKCILSCYLKEMPKLLDSKRWQLWRFLPLPTYGKEPL